METKKVAGECSFCGDGKECVLLKEKRIACESCFESLMYCSHFQCDRAIPEDKALCFEHEGPAYPVPYHELECPSCGSVGDYTTIHDDMWFCNSCDEGINPFYDGTEQLDKEYHELWS